MDTNVYEPQAKLFKTLMHPARLAILEILREGEECVCHMEAYLGFRQAYISQQLMVLREAGLVEDRRDGWNNYYRVVKPEIYAVIDAASEAIGEELAVRPVIRVLHACPCPKCSITVNHSIG
jgi:DNA-binding transcriptional ArsR family regulator